MTEEKMCKADEISNKILKYHKLSCLSSHELDNVSIYTYTPNESLYVRNSIINIIDDKELINLIEKYAKEKIIKLTKELIEL